MSTKGILSVGTPQVKVVSSQNTVIDLKRDPGYYANVKIIINYPSPYMTISEYTSGNLRNSYTIDRPYQITYILTDDDQITLNDPNNNYDVIVVVQFVQATSEAVMLYRDVRFKALPITKGFGSVMFTTSQNWTVPSGVHKIKVLAIGGGGGGGGGSSSYVGGGGGSGSIGYAEVFVQPGITLNIQVGAGGSAGTGGASPTAGGSGGASQIQYYPSQPIISGQFGNGGGAASSTANGSAGSGGSTFPTNIGDYGEIPVYAIAAYMVAGNAGNGQNGGITPEFAPGFAGASNVSNGYPGGTASVPNVSFGQGGNGGGVNANGTPGIQGVVIIWWGD